MRRLSYPEIVGLLLLALASVTATKPSHAAVCVANDSQLAIALVEAEFSPVTIQVVQGTYSLANTIWANNSGAAITAAGVSVLGGYTANCAGRNISAGNTVFMTSGSRGATVSVDGDLTLEGLTFNLAGGLWLLADNSRVEVAAGTEILIRRSEFLNTTSQFALRAYWSQDDDIGGTIRVVDTLIRDNSSGGSPYCTATIDVPEGSPDVELINNTIVDNTSGTAGVCLQNSYVDSADGHATLYAYNNIFYGNTGVDLFSDSNTLVLVDNVIGSHSYPAPLFPVIGTTTGNPKLDANFRPIEAPPSPVINTGTDNVRGGLPATDLEGRDREVGSEPDRGAYESTINDSLFQTVTNTNDLGLGSLRSAINSANASGHGAIINFDLGSSCGPNVITLQTALPDITKEAHILGYSQHGASVNDLPIGDDAEICVILDGSTHAISDGFTVPSGVADSMTLGVSGIAFSGFSHAAINLRGGSDHVVSGVHIGGTVNGVGLDPVGYGIIIGPGVHGVTIGGEEQDYGLRNIIGQAINDGVHIDGSSGSTGPAHDNQVIANYIGLGYNSTTAFNRGNGVSGVLIRGYNNDVENNFIDYNVAHGVHLIGTDAHDNTVRNNGIGALPSGSGSGNNVGVLVEAGAHDNTLASNDVFDNLGNGVQILSGLHNKVSASGFNNNGGLGIDLAAPGVTLNDNDSQGGAIANRGQNFPLLTAAIGGNIKGTFSGNLTSTPGDYRIEFFVSFGCDISGHGEGYFYLGHKTVTLPNLTVDGQTTASFSATLQNGLLQLPGAVITATATDSVNDTSEFSACLPYTNDTIFANGFDPGFF